MFDYPLSIPRNTLYEQLGIKPESLPDEIRGAKQEAVILIRQQKAKLEEKLEEIYKEIPELKPLYKTIKDSQNKTDAKELENLQKKLSELERKAREINSNFKRMQEEIAELDQKEKKINVITLDKSDERNEYDKLHPPLGLMKLADCNRDQFLERKTAIPLLRKDISRFLTEQGEPTFHPSDLTRDDFSLDFTPNQFLQGEGYE